MTSHFSLLGLTQNKGGNVSVFLALFAESLGILKQCQKEN